MLVFAPLALEAFAWFWIGLGVLSGAVLGMFFRRQDFLGGFDAWPRRMVRLGHIAFFGTGLLCLHLAGTLARHDFPALLGSLVVAGMLVGAVGMPTLCLLAAAFPRAAPLFVVPVLGMGVSVTCVYVHLASVWLGGAQVPVPGGLP
jgi:hypothetical protein